MSTIVGLSRRHLIRWAGLSVALATLPMRAIAQSPATDQTAGPRTLQARRGLARLHGADKSASPILGYGGVTPGPVLRVKRGLEVSVRLVNELTEPTSIHWHGVRVPNAMDGVPQLTQSAVAPGASFDYRFMAPDAGTFCYRPPLTSSPMARGLCGALIVEEQVPVDVDRDVVLVFDAWPPPADAGAAAGDTVTVNGAPTLDIPVKTNERLRLRLINGAPRIVALRIDRHRPVVMALDGQPAEPFVARDARIGLGPGNRADLFLDATLAPGDDAALLVDTGAGPAPVARLVYDAGTPARSIPRPDPTPLPANALPPRMDLAGALRSDIPLDGKGGADLRAAPLLSAARGRTVVLAFANRTAQPYGMHLHGHSFRLLDRLDDGWKPFWLDTLVIPPQETWRIAFVADNPGKWLIACQSLAAQALNAAFWFSVS